MADANASPIKPDPDPTALTTEALLREVGNLEKFLTRSILHEHELCDVKFGSIADQFQEIARRTAEQKSDTKAAVDAALQAAKEAVASQTAASDKSITKSETSTAEQIKAVTAQVASNASAADEKINDLKSRLDKLEGGRQGSSEQRVEERSRGADSRATLASIIGVALFLITIAGFVVALVAGKR